MPVLWLLSSNKKGRGGQIQCMLVAWHTQGERSQMYAQFSVLHCISYHSTLLTLNRVQKQVTNSRQKNSRDLNSSTYKTKNPSLSLYSLEDIITNSQIKGEDGVSEHLPSHSGKQSYMSSSKRSRKFTGLGPSNPTSGLFLRHRGCLSHHGVRQPRTLPWEMGRSNREHVHYETV